MLKLFRVWTSSGGSYSFCIPCFLCRPRARHGSGNLIQTLLKHDLVDEFRLKIFPITLGAGKRLFAKGAMPAGFKLLDSEISPGGVIVADYERAGKVKTGTFATETPTEAELARRKRLEMENERMK